MIDLAIITPRETFPYEHPTLFTDRDPALELKTPMIVLPELFTCQRCREDLPFGDFPRNAHHAAGRDYWCKPCKAAYKREANAKRRAADGLSPRTRRRPSEPEPEQPKPVKVRIIPAPKAPAAITVAEAPPISLFRQKLRARNQAAS
jgi:hypothetical protein